MYSVVLAAMLTTGAATPDWHCHAHGCYGCYGCSGYSCYGCHGCYGCSGYSCYGYSCYGSSCYGCHGCWGGVVIAPAPVYIMPAAPAEVAPALPKPKSETSAAKPANVLVKADAGARITVNDQPIVMHGIEESFKTPQLEPGQMYSYIVKAEALRDGKTVTTVKKVFVSAGEETRVDLRGQVQVQQTAKLTVLLPQDAKLYVDEVPYPGSSTTVKFETPKLEPERAYFYTLRTEVVRDGKVLRDSRVVDVMAGKEIKVEFKDLSGAQALAR